MDDLTLAKTIGISSHDFVQIYKHGISVENIQKQLEIFKNGIAKTVLDRPATVSDGILKLSKNDFVEKANFFDDNKSDLKLEKFVPASGAATRMFKFLKEFLNDFDVNNESVNAYINRKNDMELSLFIIGMDKFPFFEAIDSKLRSDFENFESLNKNQKNYYFVKLLLESDYFDFANKPKGVIPFHKYEDRIVTPIEEHLNECAYYATVNGSSNLHFTVSEAHQNQFERIVNLTKSKVENQSKFQNCCQLFLSE